MFLEGQHLPVPSSCLQHQSIILPPLSPQSTQRMLPKLPSRGSRGQSELGQGATLATLILITATLFRATAAASEREREGSGWNSNRGTCLASVYLRISCLKVEWMKLKTHSSNNLIKLQSNVNGWQGAGGSKGAHITECNWSNICWHSFLGQGEELLPVVVMQLWLLEKSSPATVLQSRLTSYRATEVAHQLQCYRGGHRSGSGDICSSSSLPPHHWSGEALCCIVWRRCAALSALCAPWEGLDVQRRLSRGAQDTNQWIEGSCGEVLWWSVMSRWVFIFTPVPGLDIKERQSRGPKIPTNALQWTVESFHTWYCPSTYYKGPKTSIPNMTFLMDNMICLLNISGICSSIGKTGCGHSEQCVWNEQACLGHMANLIQAPPTRWPLLVGYLAWRIIKKAKYHTQLYTTWHISGTWILLSIPM